MASLHQGQLRFLHTSRKNVLLLNPVISRLHSDVSESLDVLVSSRIESLIFGMAKPSLCETFEALKKYLLTLNKIFLCSVLEKTIIISIFSTQNNSCSYQQVRVSLDLK